LIFEVQYQSARLCWYFIPELITDLCQVYREAICVPHVKGHLAIYVLLPLLLGIRSSPLEPLDSFV